MRGSNDFSRSPEKRLKSPLRTPQFILDKALAEVVFISEKRRVQISLEEVLRKVEESDNFLISPFKVEHILQLVQLTSVPEMHDRLMVAEARLWNAALITKDETIRGLGIVPTIW